jgi:hypothetical protein
MRTGSAQVAGREGQKYMTNVLLLAAATATAAAHSKCNLS